MSADRLDEIEERANDATPGPWVQWGEGVYTDPDGRADVFGIVQGASMVGLQIADVDPFDRDGDGEGEGEGAVDDGADSDRTFIAHARTDVSDLVAALRRVRAEHGVEWTSHGGPEGEDAGCRVCTYYYDYEHHTAPWPCPTYLATLLPGEEA